MIDIAIHSAAFAEYVEAWNWYRERSEDAAKGFVVAFDEAIEQVRVAPLRWPRRDTQHRFKKLRHYPYCLIYCVPDEGSPFVVAVAHTSRRPTYWKHRKDDPSAT